MTDSDPTRNSDELDDSVKTMNDLMSSIRGDPERLVMRSQISGCDGVVIGVVELSGIIWDHTRGYRAQFALASLFCFKLRESE